MMLRFAAVLVILVSGRNLSAQVEKVYIRTTGISCGVCAAVSEVGFRRLPDVEHVSISLAKESILISYRQGGNFSLKAIHNILDPQKVGIVELEVTARGRVQEERGKRSFTAGKETFALSAGGNTPILPLDGPIYIEATLDERRQPLELTVRKFERRKP